MNERELDELLRPHVALTTYLDLYSFDHSHRLPAGHVVAWRVAGASDWVRVWASGKSPQSGLTVTLTQLARACQVPALSTTS